ncbi:MAG TPA: UPF0104 family protein [Methanobacteriaceae archaeon]|nr:UPF0104 family protein [Methanobacteriaceae archaeon]
MKQFYIFIVSIILIILLILWIGPEKIWGALKSANWKFVIVAIGIHLMAVWVRSLRWGYIIQQPGELKKNFVVKTIGLFAGNFSPMRTAGEVLNAVAGKKINKVSLSEGLSAGLTERFFDAIVVALLLISCALFIPKVRQLAILGGIISLGLMVFIYLINWREDTSIWIYDRVHFLIRYLPIKEEVIDELYHKFTQGLRGMIDYTRSFTNIKNLTVVITLSGVSWLLECLRLLMIFYAFNLEINFLAIVIIFLLANIVGILSALPGGIGSIEISMTGLFLLFGIPEVLSGSIALIDRLASFWVVTVLGIIFSSYYARDILDEVKSYTLNWRSS